ncbi:hypothetical protein ACJMK2_029645 [Sinanodonta woodiana]|uniref:Uncharacterized protein n=1 Tax=Sinanodonta woodiana TaxID=1069815 RepID=A0ABD3XAS7_SINWO
MFNGNIIAQKFSDSPFESRSNYDNRLLYNDNTLSLYNVTTADAEEYAVVIDVYTYSSNKQTHQLFVIPDENTNSSNCMDAPVYNCTHRDGGSCETTPLVDFNTHQSRDRKSTTTTTVKSTAITTVKSTPITTIESTPKSTIIKTTTTTTTKTTTMTTTTIKSRRDKHRVRKPRDHALVE